MSSRIDSKRSTLSKPCFLSASAYVKKSGLEPVLLILVALFSVSVARHRRYDVASSCPSVGGMM